MKLKDPNQGRSKRLCAGRGVPLPVRPAIALLLFLAIAAAGLVAAPTGAAALSVEKLTAQPNADSGNDVLGATETRITLDVRADAGEQVSGLDVTLPDGTSYTTDNLRVTMLSGADLMTRSYPKVKVGWNGQTIELSMREEVPAGAYLRVEIYGVNFPAAGGTEQLKVSYKLAGGSSHDVGNVPGIAVKGVSPVDQLATFLEQQAWVKQWNSNTFLRLFFNPPLLVSSVPVVFQGFLMALAIVLVAFPLAIPFGFALALMRISRSRVLRAISGFYVNIVRGTPAFLQIYIAFFGLPLAGVQIPSYPLGVLVMAFNSSAYLCEIFRAGIQSIPKGQSEAARSLGMTAPQTLLYIIVPQTIRNVLPTMTSEFILLYKDTSLLAAVGVMEVVMYAKTIVASTGSITPYIVAALFYLVVTLPLARLVGKLEGRLMGTDAGSRRRRRSRKGAFEPPAASDGSGSQKPPIVIDGDHIN